MNNSMLLACSKSGYEFLLHSENNIKTTFGCMVDLSYGTLQSNEFPLLHHHKEIAFHEFIALISTHTKLEIWFNSNNACEYCNFLYLLAHLPVCHITVLDTGQPICLDEGTLTTTNTSMTPINYLEEYKKRIYMLSAKQNIHYLNVWDRLLIENAALRYCRDKVIHSTNESHFDEDIKSGKIFDLLSEYGLSENWLLKRKEILK